MRAMLIPATLITALAIGVPAEPAQAAGCIKGAIAGGLAGHAVGHGVLGAAGGCVAGRTIANRSARQKQLDQQNAQYGNQGSPSGSVPASNGYNQGSVQNQGYGSSSQGPSYNSRGSQQGSSYAPGVQQN